MTASDPSRAFGQRDKDEPCSCANCIFERVEAKKVEDFRRNGYVEVIGHPRPCLRKK